MLVIMKEAVTVRKISGVFAALILAHIFVVALSPRIITNPESRNYLASGAFLGDGNDFALSVNIVIPFCLFLLLDRPGARQKMLLFAVLVFLVLCVIGTSSRGGTVALACVALYFWLGSKKKLLTAFGLGVLVGAILTFAPDNYFERMHKIKNYEDDGSAQGRLMAWRAGVRMALDHPLMGVGAGHFGVKYGVEYRPPGISPTAIPWQTAHSIYFLTLGELGFPGLTLVLWFFGSNFLANVRLSREMSLCRGEEGVRATNLLRCLNASLLAFAINGAFLSAIYSPHIFVLGGLHAAARRWVREQSSTPVLPDSTQRLQFSRSTGDAGAAACGMR
jgi:probable O-glycosylation ligase (exosortase A-associated)